MAFAGAVVSVQTSWKTKAESLEQEVSNLRNNLNAKEQQMADALAARDDEFNKIKNVNEGLLTANDALTSAKALLETQNKSLSNQRDQAQAQLTTSLEDTEARRASDRVNLEIIKTLRDKLQVLVDENRNLNDEIFKEQQINKKYFARYNEQLEKVAALTKALIVAGVDPNEATKSGAGELPPPEVQGLVLDAKQNTRSGVEWIEVSIGSNDGLKEGHELHVYRFGDGNGKKAKYLGRIKLVLLTADKAVGTVIDKAKNGVIERGDNVTTKL